MCSKSAARSAVNLFNSIKKKIFLHMSKFRFNSRNEDHWKFILESSIFKTDLILDFLALELWVEKAEYQKKLNHYMKIASWVVANDLRFDKKCRINNVCLCANFSAQTLTKNCQIFKIYMEFIEIWKSFNFILQFILVYLTVLIFDNNTYEIRAWLIYTYIINK